MQCTQGLKLCLLGHAGMSTATTSAHEGACPLPPQARMRKHVHCHHMRAWGSMQF